MITYEEILERMLDRVPDNFDKREGSMIYDALAPAAVELQLMYIELETLANESFADTASRDYLIKRAMERGLKPYPATKSVISAETTPSNLEIEIGSRFNLDDINFIIIEKIVDGQYKLECEEAGTGGNKASGQLIPMDYIEGLESIVITELLISAEDEEETEDFRKRYFDSFKSQAFGGNIKDYKEKTIGISGVGGVKVTPAWQGVGTVKLTVITSDYTEASEELIKQVKELIDPTSKQGEGYGLAPIGHMVTIESAKYKNINIQTDITYQHDWNYESSKSYIEKAIDNYFKELAKNWENEEQLVVRISQIETRLLNVEGVLDVQNTKLNEQANNLTLDSMEIPKRGIFNG